VYPQEGLVGAALIGQHWVFFQLPIDSNQEQNDLIAAHIL